LSISYFHFVVAALQTICPFGGSGGNKLVWKHVASPWWILLIHYTTCVWQIIKMNVWSHIDINCTNRTAITVKRLNSTGIIFYVLKLSGIIRVFNFTS
jgi:hypothetical protein